MGERVGLRRNARLVAFDTVTASQRKEKKRRLNLKSFLCEAVESAQRPEGGAFPPQHG